MTMYYSQQPNSLSRTGQGLRSAHISQTFDTPENLERPFRPPITLEIFKGSQAVESIHLETPTITMGRSPNNQIVLGDDLDISRFHAQIHYSGTDFLLTDLNSAQGTRINDHQVDTCSPLQNGDRIQIGGYSLIFRHLGSRASSDSLSQTTLVQDDNEFFPATVSTSQTLDLKQRDYLSIGRDPSNDLVIRHPIVSRFHSKIVRQGHFFAIFDLNSSNGTFVNGRSISGFRPLQAQDLIRIGPCNLTFKSDEMLVHQDEEGKLAIDAVDLNQVIHKDLNLLQNISLSIQPREFVVIAGVSGGGKSTLLDALSGFRPATSGHVYINGTDLYQNFNAYRTEIGYVPQRDIVHMELTVEQALDYAAQLRMPADTTRQERQQRINEVLQDLGLAHRRAVAIKSLSGGQIKRVSIGVELLNKPSLFFLDEATSGLDPGTEAEIMQLLRQLADQGCTILLITHATENVTVCDQVVFMARGGNLAYFGPPQQAPAFFGVTHFNQIYQKVEHESMPTYWQQNYLASDHYQSYISQRQALPPALPSATEPPAHKPIPGAQVKRVSSWRQFWILSRRAVSILRRDSASLMLMLAIAPVLGLLDLFAWQGPLYDTESGNASLTISMLFITSLIAVMVGCLATMREIVKERDIYRRERTIGLQIVPYILSKLWIGGFLALYQAAIFLVFKVLAVDLPSASGILIGIYITLFLSTLAGMVMGLLVSAIAPNQNVAPLIAILFLVPQIIFGGGILPVQSLGGAGQLISQASITKWSFASLMTITEFGKDIAADQCWALSAQERQQLSETSKSSCGCTGSNLFRTCQFPGIREFYDPAVDQAVPAIPQEPGEAPGQPDPSLSVSSVEYQNYQVALEAYLQQVSTYQSELEDYNQWREKYEGSIGKAEAVIERFQDKYSDTFAVNVTQNWLVLGGMSGVMLLLTIAVQKFKD